METTLISGFNPLTASLPKETFGDISNDIFSDAMKGAIQTVLSSYTGFFDLFSEAIQNALDATEKKYRKENENYTPTIWIEIDMKNSVFKVVDNGCGMNLPEFLLCFRPNMTFKKGQNLRGNKGVGATFLAYGYNFIKVQTKISGEKYAGILRQGRLWAEDEKGIISEPSFEETAYEVLELNQEISGTSIEIKLQNTRNEKPKDFGWYGATTSKQWLDILRIATPLGGIYLETAETQFSPTIHLSVIDKTGKKTTEPPQKKVEYYYPHDIPDTRGQFLHDIINEINGIPGGLKTKEKLLKNDFKDLDVMYEIWNHQELLKDPLLKLSFDEDDTALLEKYQICVYGAMVDSTKTFKKVNDDMGINNRKLMQGGLQMATDGMPQGELITIPLARYQGYQRTTLVIVHFKNGNPDMGRKTFQPELKSLAETIAIHVTNAFIGYIEVLRPDDGSDKIIRPDKEKHDWKKAVESWRDANQLAFQAIHPNFSYLSKAKEEQDVIAIYHQLIGCGLIKGINFYSSHYNEKYDGLFEYNYNSSDTQYSSQNIIGIRNNIDLPCGSEPKVIEYKYDLNSLLDEIDKNKKFFEHIDLLVCWRATGAFKKELILKSLLIENEGNSRMIYGSTHIAYLRDSLSRHKIEVVILEDLLNYIISPDEEIANQKSKYK